jgi:hypothetical protein
LGLAREPAHVAILAGAGFGSERTEDLAMFGFLRHTPTRYCQVVNLIIQVSGAHVKSNLATADLRAYCPNGAASSIFILGW